MPKQIFEIKDFLLKARRRDAKSVTVKVNQSKNKNRTTKFKLRTTKYLYTLVVRDAQKAKKIKNSFPPELNVDVIQKKKVL
mmetsp:Transcript_8595/g.12671  ORF Transcript_8595/g.12671 Transcript_8595/m.12671 type:complete len:81 (+) Transcript_8595:40-282(+)